MAINSIVNRKNELPFLLFGPPGTGKTKTIVAAISELVNTTTKSVLVCSQSNGACNELTERLIQVLQHGQIIRVCARSTKEESLSSNIIAISNLKNGEFCVPSMSFLYRFRVVVCTLIVAGLICRGRGVDPDFKSDHFSYVFIDEAAFVHETAALIPIAGNFDENENLKLSIIMFQ